MLNSTESNDICLVRSLSVPYVWSRGNASSMKGKRRACFCLRITIAVAGVWSTTIDNSQLHGPTAAEVRPWLLVQEIWANAYETRNSIGDPTLGINVQRAIITRFERGTHIWRPGDYLNLGGRNLDR